MIWTLAFWKGTAERAIKTFFQTLAALIGALAVGIDAGLGDVDWLSLASVAALAAGLSVATSIGNANFTAGAPVPTPVPAPEAASPMASRVPSGSAG